MELIAVAQFRSSRYLPRMKQAKRHHFVPKAYLKAFCDTEGKIFVYRKDAEKSPLHVKPDATQFRGYYYSQPKPNGGRDNNSLEQFFSDVESKWPDTVAKLHQRENVNDRLGYIFEFMSLQRVRVPAARDVAEAMLAQTVRDSMNSLHVQGKLPPLPTGSTDLLSRVEISIDPHQSIHAMVPMLRAMGPLYSSIGLVALHNLTERPFLTSDNPVFWFDPSLPFSEQQPYTYNVNGGPVSLIFPISPKLALIGDTEYTAAYRARGLLHLDSSDEGYIEWINEQISRFAYEAVIAKSIGQETLISKFADVSPVHKAVNLPTAKGFATIHMHAFGARSLKPKWRDS